jgi:5'(3')-deoxyribonucleotidase
LNDETTMTTTTIYIDFDNVLADTTNAVLQLVNKDLDRLFSVDDIVEYDFHTILGISKKQLWKYFERVWSDIFNLVPIEYNKPQYTIGKLLEMNYDVQVVTGCGKPIVEKWLEHWYYPKLKVTYVSNGADKVGNKGDILVDDNPKHLDYAANTDRFPIVFDRPWNRDFDYGTLDRIHSLKELPDVIEKIDNYKSEHRRAQWQL